jgi:hypothetical protein
MQRSRSTTYWGILAGATALALLGAAATPAQTGSKGRPGRDWWSLQPLRTIAVPSVDDSQWPINPIDHFIQHRLKKEGLTPSPTADLVFARQPTDGEFAFGQRFAEKHGLTQLCLVLLNASEFSYID